MLQLEVSTLEKLMPLYCLLLLLMTGCGLKTVSISSNEHISGIEYTNDNAEASALDRQADKLFFSATYEQSADLYQQALTLRENTFGKDDIRIVPNLYHLATIHEVNTEYVDAIKIYKRALGITKKYSDIHSKTIEGFIAVLFEARGLIGQSKNSAHQTASIYKKFTKEKHAFYGIVLYKLASFYWQENNINKANNYFQLSIAAIKQNIGEHHPYLAVVLDDYIRFSALNNIEIDNNSLKQQAIKIRRIYPKKQRCEIYKKANRKNSG